MDEAKLQEIEARANAATPGPWEPEHRGVVGNDVFIVEDCVTAGWDAYRANQAFIATARTDVPDLVAEVRRLTAALATVTAEHAAALAAARREGAEGMREVVKAEIHAAFHYNDPPDDGVERPIGPIPGQWEAHQTLRKLLSRVCAVLTEGGAS